MLPNTKEFTAGFSICEDFDDSKIIQHPHILLYTETDPVDVVGVSEKSIKQIYKYMLAVLDKTENGIALAANQAGFDKSFFIERISPTPQMIINPTVTYIEGMDLAKMPNPEGCLSLPPECYVKEIYRFPVIKVDYWLYPGMVEVTNRLVYALEAQMFQHEIEHLRGHTLLTRFLS